jgi:DNA-binding XRE family transcriptional regulator
MQSARETYRFFCKVRVLLNLNTNFFAERMYAPMDPKNNQLGIFLKDKRSAAGLSQADVAKKLGYTTSQFISNWERGLSTPPIDVLKILADMYDISADHMLKAVLDSTIHRVTLNLRRKFYGKKAM